jgi:outer membrane lipoprotein SlyB
MRMLTRVLLPIACVALIIGGCASSRSDSVYSRSQARQAHSVYYGTVLEVQEVTIEGTQSGIGAISGGVLGGVAGSAIGGGKGSNIAAAAGAIGGMLAGAAAEKGVTTKDGLEIMVELDSGELKVIVQEKDNVYAVGNRVRLIAAPDGTWRVRQ